MPHHLRALIGLAALAVLGSGCEFFDWEPDPLTGGGGGGGGGEEGTCPSGYPTAATGTSVIAVDDQPFGSFNMSVRPLGDAQLELFGCVLAGGAETVRISTLWTLPGPVAAEDDAVQAVVPSSSSPGMFGAVNDLAADQLYEFLNEGNGLMEVSRWDPAGNFQAEGSVAVDGGTVSIELDLEW